MHNAHDQRDTFIGEVQKDQMDTLIGPVQMLSMQDLLATEKTLKKQASKSQCVSRPVARTVSVKTMLASCLCMLSGEVLCCM